jgi:hypothetical protein
MRKTLRRTRVFGVIFATASAVPTLAYAQPETEPTPVPAAPAPPPTMPPATPPAPDLVEQTPAGEGRAPPPPAKVDGGDRVIKGHVFIFPNFVASSIVASYVGVRVVLGASDASNVPIATGETANIDSLTLNEGFDLGIKITDWFGLYATGGVRSLIGTNLKALTYAGATYDIGAGGGAIVRLFRSDKSGSQLSARLSGSYANGQFSSLLPIFQNPAASAVAALQGDLGSSIKTPFSSVGYSGALAFAQSFGRFFGLQAAGGFGGSHITSEPYIQAQKSRNNDTVDDFTYSIGAALSFDFNAWQVPIAIMPEYLLAREASSATIRGAGDFDTVHTVALGAYYSGRKTLQLGLAVSTRLSVSPLITPQGQSDAPNQTSGHFVLRYIW